MTYGADSSDPTGFRRDHHVAALRQTVRRLTLLLALLLATSSVAEAQSQQKASTFVIARTGAFTAGGDLTYRFVESFQVHGRWVFPDLGYLDFGRSDYKELFVGGGATLVGSKHFTLIGEGYFVQAVGSASDGARYFQPWTYIGYRITPKLGGETVYFPYLPLNDAGRIQHVLERAKLEYSFQHWMLGAGYAGYRFGDGEWQNKPFITTTLKAGTFGNLEFWLQRMPSNTAQVQVRYAKVF